MRAKINRSAILAAACAAALPSIASAAEYAWTTWGNLGIADVSMAGNTAATRSPRQFGLVVANNQVFGAYNSGGLEDSAPNDVPLLFRSPTPGSISTQLIGDGTYAGASKIIYNNFDQRLYVAASAQLDWDTASGGIYPSIAKGGIIAVDANNLANQQVIFRTDTDQPASGAPPAVPGAAPVITGLTYDYDNHNVLFSTNHLANRTAHNFFYRPQDNTVTTLTHTATGQNGAQRPESMVYVGNNRFAWFESGFGNLNLMVDTYNPTATSGTAPGSVPGKVAVTAELNYTGNNPGSGDGNGGITNLVFDRAGQTLHVLGRMQFSSDRLINTDFFPAAAGQQFGAAAPANPAGPGVGGRWHANIPGANLKASGVNGEANVGAGDSNGDGGGANDTNNVVAVNSSVLTPDGNLLIGFAGDKPYGVSDGETHLWLKNLDTNANGYRTGGTSNNWTDLGVIDPGGGQVVSIAIGNIGVGNLGSGRNSYDAWVVTQNRTGGSAGQLKLFSTWTAWNQQRVEWDPNGADGTANGATPTGNWDGATANFNTDLAGGNTGTTLAATTSSSVVGFAAGNDGSGTYSVNVVGPQTAGRIDFERGNVTLVDGGSSAKISAGGYDVASGATGTLAVDVNGNVVKRGAGTLILSGPKTNTGVTTVNNGTLLLGERGSLYNADTGQWTAANITVDKDATLALNVGGATGFTSADIDTISALGSGNTGFKNGGILGIDTTNAGGAFTHAGNIANANSLVVAKLGTGELHLTGNNAYTGGTLVNGGTLSTEGASPLGTGPLTVNNGTTVLLSPLDDVTTGSLGGNSGSSTVNNNGRTYTVNQTTNTTYPGMIRGAGGVTKSGAGTLSLTGASDYTGATTISQGTLSISSLQDNGINGPLGPGGTATAADLVLNGGTLQYAGGGASHNRLFTVGTAGGTIDASGTNAFTFTNSNPIAYNETGPRTLTLSGTNTGLNSLAPLVGDNGGATSLTKTGAGKWVVANNANTFTGPVTVAGGTLSVGSMTGSGGAASAIGQGTSIVLSGGGTLSYSGTTNLNQDRQITLGAGGGTFAAGEVAGATPVIELPTAIAHTGAGARTLGLGGTSTGANRITGLIADGASGTTAVTSVTKSGAGTWTIQSNSNSYTGVTSVTGGTLTLRGTQPLGNPANIGASPASVAQTNNRLITSANTTVNLTPDADTYLESLQGGGGTINLGLDTSTPTPTPRNLYLLNGASGDGGDVTFSGAIVGAGQVHVGTPNNVQAPGAVPANVAKLLTFSGGTNAFSGGLFIDGGNVFIASSSSLNNAANVGGIDIPVELNNLRTDGPNTIRLEVNGTTTNTGTFGGTIATAGNNARLLINSNRTFVVQQKADKSFAGFMDGPGAFQLGVRATSTLTLLQASPNYTGTITLAAGGSGTLQAKIPGALPGRTTAGKIVVNSGQTIAANVGGAGEWATADIDQLRTNATLNAGGRLGLDTTNAGGSFTYPTSIASGAYGLTKLGTGSLVLTGTNAYTGGTIIKTGTLQLGANGTTGSITGAVSNNGVLVFNRSDSLLFAGNISGTGSVSHIGGGTTTLSGNNTHSGGVNVSAGMLLVGSGTALGTGTTSVAAGALAQITASQTTAITVGAVQTTGSGQFDLTNNSMVLRTTTPGDVRAEIVKAYNAGAWNGTGGLTSSTAAAAATGTTGIGYALNSDLGTLTTFKGVTGLAATDVLVKYTYFGDADLDGDVDGNDVGNWAGNFTGSGGSTTKTWFQGDWDYDGDVDGNDVGFWAGNFTGSGGGILNLPNAQPGAIAALEAMGFTVVPEPASVSLLAFGGLALGRRRRRS